MMGFFDGVSKLDETIVSQRGLGEKQLEEEEWQTETATVNRGSVHKIYLYTHITDTIIMIHMWFVI